MEEAKATCWLLSGSTRSELVAEATGLRQFLAQQSSSWRPAEVTAALLTKKVYRQVRAAIVGSSRDELIDGLAAVGDGHIPSRALASASQKHRAVVLVFSGLGGEWPAMGQSLFAESDSFRRLFTECATAFDGILDWSMIDAITGGYDPEFMQREEVKQPLLFALMVSLAKLWIELGIQPAAVVGHSVGEIAAACVSGALSLKDAALVAAARWPTKHLVGKGSMLVAALTRDELMADWSDALSGVSLSAVNSPNAVVLGGEMPATEQLLHSLRSKGVRATIAAVTHCPHTPQVEAIKEAVLEGMASISPRAGHLPFYSTVEGTEVDGTELDANYWYRNLRECVEFDKTLRVLLRDGADVFLEIGPHPILASNICETIDAVEGEGVVVSSLHRGDGGITRILRSAADLHTNGVRLSWERLLDLPLSESVLKLPTIHIDEDTPPTGGIDFAARVKSLSHTDAKAMALDLILDTVRLFKNLPDASAVEESSTFHDMGLNSLAAIEMRNVLSEATGLRLSVSLPFDHPTPSKLAEYLVAVTLPATPTQATPAREVPVADDLIAIVGIGCRLPGGANSAEDLWDLVEHSRDVITEFPTDRGWDTQNLYSPNLDDSADGKSYVCEGGFVDGAAGFDPEFFGISPREATAMDPQQRLALEVAWEALENAAIDPSSLSGSPTGTFMGVAYADYGTLLDAAGSTVTGLAWTGRITAAVAGRLAYFLGLEGPTISIDTACSSSLVSLHLACASLRNRECSLALAGGATVMSTPGLFTEFSRQRVLSPDSRCKAFAENADGIGWAEGVGVVVLERLTDAVSKGRNILAVVRGSAVNQDGASNGFSAPNGSSQRKVISAALASAGLAAHDVDAVEAHGTGTVLGDPIEAQALQSVYGPGRNEQNPLWLGSLKSNIGHAHAAAGVAGVIKVVMSLKHQLLPATLHIGQPTTQVDWSGGQVRLLTEAVPWPRGDRPRRAGVSSFGITGTNAHLILEEAPSLPHRSCRTTDFIQRKASRTRDEAVPAFPLAVSASSRNSLAKQAHQLREYLESQPTLSPANLGYSTLTGRALLRHRAIVSGATHRELIAGLQVVETGTASWNVASGIARSRGKTAFVFPGQGSEWLGMGRQLAISSTVFRESLEECSDALSARTDWSLLDVVNERAGAAPLERIDVVQPALFAIMLSIAAVWRSYGLRPAGVVGHSQGEIAAACITGVLSLEDAAHIVVARSKALLELSGSGSMLSIQLPSDDVHELLNSWPGRISIAAVNGPSAVVVSGDPVAIKELDVRLTQIGIRVKRIVSDVAGHSSFVDPICANLRNEISGITAHRVSTPFYSTVTGGRIQDTTSLNANYWVQNLRKTVQFQQACHSLLGSGHDVFVEMSPHPTLLPAIEATAERDEKEVVVVGSLQRHEDESRALLVNASKLCTAGVPLDWEQFFAGSGARLITLPSYAFSRQRYWLDGVDRRVGPLIAQVGPGACAESGVNGSEPSGEALPLRELTSHERERVILEMVVAHAASVLRYGAGQTMDSARSFFELGFDSLMVVELRNRLTQSANIFIPAKTFFDYPTPADLARYISEHIASPVENQGDGELPAEVEHEFLDI